MKHFVPLLSALIKLALIAIGRSCVLIQLDYVISQAAPLVMLTLSVGLPFQPM